MNDHMDKMVNWYRKHFVMLIFCFIIFIEMEEQSIMKGNRHRYYVFLLTFIFILSSMPVYAGVAEPVNYDTESAVRIGLSNSVLLKQLKNKVKLSDLKYDIYKSIGNQLISGEEELQKGEQGLDAGISELDEKQEALNDAKLSILNGILPEGSDDVVIVPGALVIKAEDNIAEKITAFNAATGAGLDVDGITAKITSTVNKALAAKQKLLDKGKVSYEKNSTYLMNGEIDYAVAKATVSSALADNLGASTLDGFPAKYDANLLLDMAEASSTITVAAEGIYRNQIALMIQNSYYNVLKAQKLLAVKQSTMKRAEVQLQNAKDGFEAGMKAKDDVLLASIYNTGTKLEYEKALGDYNNALTELKKNMNIPEDQAVILEDAAASRSVPLELGEGLESGASNRLEVIKAEQQLKVYDAYMKLVDKRYSSSIKKFKEAELLQENAELELEKVKKDVESSIRQSYSTMVTMEKLLAEAGNMAEQARECLVIAQEKYKEGYGADSTLMKKLGLEASAGTMLEVISAEENLAQVEEKYVEILYGYNLSKAKYLIDIGYLTY